ncbi:MAG: hypothetical protein AAGE03_12295 [Pseudomonadota bacterium]
MTKPAMTGQIMKTLNYRFRVMRKTSTGGGLSVQAMLANVGIGRPPELAIFEDPTTWAALEQAPPGVKALLSDVGFENLPAGYEMPPGWVPSDRSGYLALQQRLREALPLYDVMERPEDAFQLDQFLEWVPKSMPEKGHVPMYSGAHTGRDPSKESRLKWVGLLAASAGAVCAGIYFLAVKPTMEARDRLVAEALDRAWAAGQPTNVEQALEKAGIEGVPVEDPAVAQAATALFVGEALRRAQAMKDGRQEEVVDDAALQQLRESLEALRNR